MVKSVQGHCKLSTADSTKSHLMVKMTNYTYRQEKVKCNLKDSSA